MTADDRTLLGRFAATADQAAFAELVARHGPLVWGVCRRAVKGDQLADEAFQAVFVILSRKAGSLTLRTSLANWLFGVASRVARRAVRRETRLKLRERKVMKSAATDSRTARERDAIGSPEWQDMLRVLDEELAGVAEKFRGPLVACYLQGKTQDEAAADLGVSIHKLRRRLAKARELLRLRLTRRGVTMAGVLFAGAVIADVGFAATVPATTATAALKAGVAAKSGGTVAVRVAALSHGGSGVAAWCVGLAVLAIAGVILFPRNEPASLPANPEPPPATATAPAEWVSVRGQVVWPGELPTPRFANVTADVASCCRNGPLPDTYLLVDAKSRGVKNVVVWLRPDTDDRTDTFPADRAHPDLRIVPPRTHEIDQPSCQFEPRVLAAREGDLLVFKNSASIPHNVNIVSDYHDLNRTIPSGGNYRVTQPLVAEAIPLMVKCDIHPWMTGRVRVFNHPYFAVTDADGHFEMKLVPAGRWRVVYWHEGGFHKGKQGATGIAHDLMSDTELPEVALKLPE